MRFFWPYSMIMAKSIGAVVTIALAGPVCADDAKVGIEFVGVWEGTVSADGPRKCVLEISDQGRGTIAVLSQPEGGAELRGKARQNGAQLTISLANPNGGTGLHGVLTIKVREHGTELHGTLFGNEKGFPVKLTKTKALAGALRIRGTAIHPDGSPALAIEIEPVDEGNPATTVLASSMDGSFESERLRPGLYRVGVDLGINRQPHEAYGKYYYQGTTEAANAAKILVSEDFITPWILFVLPRRRPTVTLRGTVVYEDGKPASGVDVLFSPAGGYATSQVWTDSEGRFRETTYGSVGYCVRSNSTDGKFESRPVLISAEDLEKPIVLVLRPATSGPARQ